MATTQAHKRDGSREVAGIALEKVPTGIRGLDQVTHGGFPKGRTALVCGGPGTGKTLLGLEFLVRGAQLYNEPGVCVAFEETVQELTTNMAPLGYNLHQLVRARKLAIDYVEIERKQIEETGEYSLDGLFVRLKQAIEEIKAKRVLLDTVELLFLGLKNEGVVRSELRRLFHWLKDAGLSLPAEPSRVNDFVTEEDIPVTRQRNNERVCPVNVGHCLGVGGLGHTNRSSMDDHGSDHHEDDEQHQHHIDHGCDVDAAIDLLSFSNRTNDH